MSERRRRRHRVRWTDVVGVFGLAALASEFVARYVSGTPGDPTLTYAAVLLALGSPLGHLATAARSYAQSIVAQAAQHAAVEREAQRDRDDDE